MKDSIDATRQAIEAEMMRLGTWDAAEGTFEHWLRHHLDEPVYDRAHDEWVKWGPEDDGPTALLVLLRRLDRLLEFHPKVVRFGHYATRESSETGGFNVVHGRTLFTSFTSDDVARIAWQIEMEHEKRPRMLEMILAWKIVKLADGSTFASGTHRTILPGDWTKMAFAQYWGWPIGGRWPKGRYRTTVSYWGAPIAEDEFEIV